MIPPLYLNPDAVKTIVRIVSYKGKIKVYRYKIKRHKPDTGRIISNCPDTMFQGTPLRRVRQFNQWGHYEFEFGPRPEDIRMVKYTAEYVLLTIPAFFREDLKFFRRKYQRATSKCGG